MAFLDIHTTDDINKISATVRCIIQTCSYRILTVTYLKYITLALHSTFYVRILV